MILGILLIVAGIIVGFAEGYFMGMSIIGVGLAVIGVIALLIGIALKIDKNRRW